jgi:hypothetical protein
MKRSRRPWRPGRLVRVRRTDGLNLATGYNLAGEILHRTYEAGVAAPMGTCPV